jgi:ribosomal protein S12 methylthiotransferase accessory factor
MQMLDLGGTYRALTPKQTLEKLEPLLLNPFGITRVANITGLDNIDIPTYISIRPLSKLLSTSQGKGMTHDLAKISAIMESVEGWHAENLKPPELIGTYNDLSKKYHLIDIHKLPLDAFFNRYLYDMEIDWASGLDLHTGAEIYFPRSMINLDMTLSRFTGVSKYFTTSSNGLASGNTYEEALCHGLFEVIERHAWAEAQLKPLQFIDFANIQSPHIKAILQCLDFRKVHLEVYNATDVLRIPTYVARLTDLTGLHALGTYIGAGTHLSSVVALSRAITEAVQSRVTIISGSRDDKYPSVYQAKQGNKTAPRFSSKERVPFVETQTPIDFSDSIDQTLQRLSASGFKQVIVYNHTREEIGIPTVHVLIPGMKMDIFKHISLSYLPEQLCSRAFIPKFLL